MWAARGGIGPSFEGIMIRLSGRVSWGFSVEKKLKMNVMGVRRLNNLNFWKPFQIAEIECNSLWIMKIITRSVERRAPRHIIIIVSISR